MRNFLYKLQNVLCKPSQAGGGICVLMYHEVLPDSVDMEAWTVVKQSEFEKQINFLLDGHSIISLDEALLMVKEDVIDKWNFVVTFDDGYSGNYDVVFPFIAKNNVPITIYVATQATQQNIIYWYDEIIGALQSQKQFSIDLSVFSAKSYSFGAKLSGEQKWTKIQDLLQDIKSLASEQRAIAVASVIDQLGRKPLSERMIKHLTIDQIREMSESSLVTIGAHSHCHSMLPTIPRVKALQSIIESKRLLEEWTAGPIVHFSYPNGDYDEAVLQMIQECGFKSGVTTRSDFWKCEDSRFEIPRLGVGRFDSLDKFRFRIARPDR